MDFPDRATDVKLNQDFFSSAAKMKGEKQTKDTIFQIKSARTVRLK